MEKMSKNKFLLMMGGVFGVAAVAFFILVFPLWNSAGSTSNRIKADTTKVSQAAQELPGEPNIAEWQSHADALKKRYQDSLKGFTDVDRNLSQWFDDVGDTSTFAAFMTKYDDERNKLELELREKGVLLGSPEIKEGRSVESGLPGFNWVQKNEIAGANSKEDEDRAKEILQKRFNICRAIVNAVIVNADKGRQRRLLDVSFLEKFPFLPKTVGGESKAVLEIKVDRTRYAGFSSPTATYVEYFLPLNGDVEDKVHLGKTITFGFAVQMEYHHVPELIRNLIAPAVEPLLKIAVVGWKAFVPEPNPAVKTEKKEIRKGDDTAAFDKEAEEVTNKCKPALIHAYFTCQVFDLDTKAVPAFLKP